MANNTISTNGQVQYGISEFVVDSPEDIQKLPLCGMGSSVICLSNGNVYMKNSSGEWIEL
jgi:hypothetical protein